MASLTARIVHSKEEFSIVENIKESNGVVDRSELIQGVERLKGRLNESLTKLVEQEKASGVHTNNSNGAADEDLSGKISKILTITCKLQYWCSSAILYIIYIFENPVLATDA